jgi:hypothetical protein
MASAQDILDSINGANTRLDNVNNKLDTVNSTLNDVKAGVLAVNNSIQQVQTLLQWGLSQLISLGQYTNQALFQNDKQNETMICILEHISQNTCGILNQATVQTRLQTSIDKNTDTLADLYAATHAEAELARKREDELRRQIEECCPPKLPPSACDYKPCPAPDQWRERPPEVQPPPRFGPIPPS